MLIKSDLVVTRNYDFISCVDVYWSFRAQQPEQKDGFSGCRVLIGSNLVL